MPPSKKPQPSKDEITILKWWVASGASKQGTLNQLSPPSTVTAAIDRLRKMGPKKQSSIENLKAIAEIAIDNVSFRNEKIDLLISKFELDAVRDIKANFLSGGQKKKLVIAIALISDPKILLLDEPFAALDVLTIKTLQEIIVNLQSNNNISIVLCDHQARDLLACVDTAAIIHNGKVVAQGTPNNLIQNIDARKAYFGESFKIS